MIKILTTLLASGADSLFHNWCESVGIETPFARLRTTSESVAGRGVFAGDDIAVGDVAIRIPDEIVLHEHNGRRNFPELAKKVEKQKRRSQRRTRLRRLFSRGKDENSAFSDVSDFWQAELAMYVVACLEEEKDHPWFLWISQWQRSDPMQRLLESGVSWRDETAISKCAEELHEMLPDVAKQNLHAAIYLRLRRLDELKTTFRLEDSIDPIHGILSSRAIDLGGGIVGVLPMLDMINHSINPNLALQFDGTSHFELWALRDIKEGEELFLCYSDDDSRQKWDEGSALWTLIQWGIPQINPARLPSV